jgi:hypothetical protein
MIGLGSLSKLASRGLGPDEINALLSGLSIKVDMGQVEYTPMFLLIPFFALKRSSREPG